MHRLRHGVATGTAHQLHVVQAKGARAADADAHFRPLGLVEARLPQPRAASLRAVAARTSIWQQGRRGRALGVSLRTAGPTGTTLGIEQDAEKIE